MNQATKGHSSVNEGPSRISYMSLFLTFFRIGLMTFGGGFAMAAVLRHELVLKKRWISEKDFLNKLSTATAVPGAVAVNIAFVEGWHLRGLRGGLAAAVGAICPSVLAILLIVWFVLPYFDQPVVAAFFKGCAIAVTAQIAFAGFAFARKLRPRWQNVFICGLGLSILIFRLHPLWAIIAAAGFGYLLMRERMTLLGVTEQEDPGILELIDGIMAEELIRGVHEADLKAIIHEQDEAMKARFCTIIEECPVLDIEHSMSAEEFLDIAAGKLAEKLGTNAGMLSSALKKRETEGGTVLNQWLAVPHVVLDGKGIFKILIARSRSGVRFSQQASEVQAIFVLVGSLDERSFYLRALAAIARIAGDEELHERWLRAKGPKGLRDTLLLTKQMRIG